MLCHSDDSGHLSLGCHIANSDVAPGIIVSWGNACAGLPGLAHGKTTLDGDNIRHHHCHSCSHWSQAGWKCYLVWHLCGWHRAKEWWVLSWTIPHPCPMLSHPQDGPFTMIPCSPIPTFYYLMTLSFLSPLSPFIFIVLIVPSWLPCILSLCI